MAFNKEQSLNEWVAMLDGLYGSSQNYAKTHYEIHSHLTEVCGIFAKHQFKRHDTQQAIDFLPKMFAWAVGLLKKINPAGANLEEIILRKFPGVCPYCASRPCECWRGEKPPLNAAEVLRLFKQNSPTIRRTVDDFQLLFRETYESSWNEKGDTDPITRVYIRLNEELAEVAEAVRFHHLYPENFENELADFFAWWFALVSCMTSSGEGRVLLASDVLWKAYPGTCTHCQMLPCYCRPGPVRELMSKPPPGQLHRFDALTNTLNQGAYLADIEEISKGGAAALPIACVRVDLDDFKSVNETYGHNAGDQALKHVASMLQRKLRERDRLYRVGGDEFAVLFFDYSGEEATGLMVRSIAALHATPVRWVDAKKQVFEFTVTVSVGVAETSSSENLNEAFELADTSASQSKKAGKARVTRSAQ
ncbi:diguanylate cyclase [Polaromonas sp. LjRoot131]|uniref:diguanylate cyclase n=1 Tax=Polaromonas sp. LjRoot131 TaxID=3342262 RepID=UPI003ECDD620